eukprot:UN28437
MMFLKRILRLWRLSEARIILLFRIFKQIQNLQEEFQTDIRVTMKLRKGIQTTQHQISQDQKIDIIQRGMLILDH